MNDNLKACPFCGSSPLVFTDDGDGDCIIACRCEPEPCVIRRVDDIEGAVNAWNRRQ